MRKTMLLALLVCFGLTGCNLGSSKTPTPTPTAMVVPTFTPSPTLTGPTNTPTGTPVTATPTPTFTPVGGAPNDSAFCGDAQVTALLASFKTAMLTSNGALFSSLVSPSHGMDVRYWRNGRVVKYDQYHAKFLFETTFKVNWGAAPGSGQATIGSFHDVIIPPLRSVLNAPSTINVCNQIKTGGATYTPQWPYFGVNFYSIHYPGTQQNGNLDWRTWLVGVEYVQSKPYLHSLIHLNWEP